MCSQRCSHRLLSSCGCSTLGISPAVCVPHSASLQLCVFHTRHLSSCVCSTLGISPAVCVPHSASLQLCVFHTRHLSSCVCYTLGISPAVFVTHSPQLFPRSHARGNGDRCRTASQIHCSLYSMPRRSPDLSRHLKNSAQLPLERELGTVSFRVFVQDGRRAPDLRFCGCDTL